MSPDLEVRDTGGGGVRGVFVIILDVINTSLQEILGTFKERMRRMGRVDLS
jgi:hypothetical protein